MMDRSSVVVIDDDVRPARPDGSCFYCLAILGETHFAECVLVQKWVRATVTMDVRIAVPWSTTKDQIEFRYNEGTWCFDNLIVALAERMELVDAHQDGQRLDEVADGGDADF